MRTHPSLLLVLIGLSCGCASERFTKGHGDVGQFIIQQAVIRGGQPATTNGLPTISGRWRYSKDEYGVVIQMSRERYPAVASLLQEAFGEPKLGPADTKDGGKLGEYRFTPKGGGIQFGCDVKQAWVIVIRPLSKQEFGEAFSRAMKDKRFWENLSK